MNKIEEDERVLTQKIAEAKSKLKDNDDAKA
jgi:hypothetical protein